MVFTVLALVWILGAFLLTGNRDMQFAIIFWVLFWWPFIAGGVWLSAMWASRAWLRILARKTVYALTNRRVIVWQPSWFGRVTAQSFTASGLNQMFRMERPDGAGDLVFQVPVTAFRANSQPERRGFVAIDNVREVEELVRKTLLVDERPLNFPPDDRHDFPNSEADRSSRSCDCGRDRPFAAPTQIRTRGTTLYGSRSPSPALRLRRPWIRPQGAGPPRSPRSSARLVVTSRGYPGAASSSRSAGEKRPGQRHSVSAIRSGLFVSLPHCRSEKHEKEGSAAEEEDSVLTSHGVARDTRTHDHGTHENIQPKGLG